MHAFKSHTLTTLALVLSVYQISSQTTIPGGSLDSNNPMGDPSQAPSLPGDSSQVPSLPGDSSNSPGGNSTIGNDQESLINSPSGMDASTIKSKTNDIRKQNNKPELKSNDILDKTGEQVCNQIAQHMSEKHNGQLSPDAVPPPHDVTSPQDVTSSQDITPPQNPNPTDGQMPPQDGTPSDGMIQKKHHGHFRRLKQLARQLAQENGYIGEIVGVNVVPHAKDPNKLNQWWFDSPRSIKKMTNDTATDIGSWVQGDCYVRLIGQSNGSSNSNSNSTVNGPPIGQPDNTLNGPLDDPSNNLSGDLSGNPSGNPSGSV